MNKKKERKENLEEKEEKVEKEKSRKWVLKNSRFLFIWWRGEIRERVYPEGENRPVKFTAKEEKKRGGGEERIKGIKGKWKKIWNEKKERKKQKRRK